MPCTVGPHGTLHTVYSTLPSVVIEVADNISDVGRAFKYYDKDGSGAIDYTEFRDFLGHRYNLFMNEYEFRRLMHQVDPDRSGEVDFEEFIGFFQRKNLDPRTWGLGPGGVNLEKAAEMNRALESFQPEEGMLPSPPASSRGVRYIGENGTAAATTPRTSRGSLRSRMSSASRAAPWIPERAYMRYEDQPRWQGLKMV